MKSNSNRLRTTEPPFDGEALRAKYPELQPAYALDDLLAGIDEPSFGASHPDDGEAPLRRMFGAEFQGELRRVVAGIDRLNQLDRLTYPGALTLAIADLYGARSAQVMEAALLTYEGMRERSGPLKPTAELAAIIAEALAEQWERQGGPPAPDRFLSFVRDALQGRRRFPKGVIEAEVLNVTEQRGWWRQR